MLKIYSFDVFDTVLVRRVAVPSDVSRMVGKRIANELRLPSQVQFEEDFLLARLLAERQSLENREECTLDQIWEALHKNMLGIPKGIGPQYELDAEKKVLLPNELISQQINALRLKSAKIIFVSDTYLPAEFVRSELIRHGIAADGDGFYISSALGVTKRSGSLFRKILADEGVSASEIVHYGDNYISDVKVPARLGIASKLSTSGHLNRWERAVLTNKPSSRDASSEMAGSMRAFRLGLEALQVQPSVHELTATFLGPIMALWAAWVLGAAQRDGIRRLYFAARDGHLLWRAARILAPQFGDIECRYLKISRQSVLLPSTDEISAAGMPWLQRPWEPARLERLVKKLGLAWPDVASAFSDLAKSEGQDKVLTNESDWKTFWKVVQKAPVVDQVRERIKTQRSALHDYLHSEGFFDSERVGLVDIGWHLTVQAGLQKLVSDPHRPFAIRGYYLGLNTNRIAPAFAGPSLALFYDGAGDQNSIVNKFELFRRVNILEHLFGMAPHGTVREYLRTDTGVEPACSVASVSYQASVSSIVQALEIFCRDYASRAANLANEDAAREIIDTLIKAWCEIPNSKALEVLANVTVSDDPNNLDARPLLETWRFSDAAKSLLPERLLRRLNLTVRYPTWPEIAHQRMPLVFKMLRSVRNVISKSN